MNVLSTSFTEFPLLAIHSAFFLIARWRGKERKMKEIVYGMSLPADCLLACWPFMDEKIIGKTSSDVRLVIS